MRCWCGYQSVNNIYLLINYSTIRENWTVPKTTQFWHFRNYKDGRWPLWESGRWSSIKVGEKKILYLPVSITERKTTRCLLCAMKKWEIKKTGQRTTYRRIRIAIFQIEIKFQVSAWSAVCSSWTIALQALAITGSTWHCCFIANEEVARARGDTATFLLVVCTCFTKAWWGTFTTYTLRVTWSAFLYIQNTMLCQ